MEGFEIRPARPQDAEAIARLSREALGYDCTAALVLQKLRAALKNPRERVFIAESGGAVAGYILSLIHI